MNIAALMAGGAAAQSEGAATAPVLPGFAEAIAAATPRGPTPAAAIPGAAAATPFPASTRTPAPAGIAIGPAPSLALLATDPVATSPALLPTQAATTQPVSIADLRPAVPANAAMTETTLSQAAGQAADARRGAGPAAPAQSSAAQGEPAVPAVIRTTTSTVPAQATASSWPAP